MSEDIKNLKTIVDLRNHALRTILKLERGEIDVDEVGVTAKLYESVISSVRTELQYANMLGMKPKVDFIEDSSVFVGELAPKNMVGRPRQLKLTDGSEE